LAEAKRALDQKEQIVARLSGELAVARMPNSPPPFAPEDERDLEDGANFSIRRHVPDGGTGGRDFQVVTQSLNVHPVQRDGADETERLRRDVRRLRDYLTTSVQERRYLLKKIGSLNQQLERGGGAHEVGGNSKAILMQMANLQEKVATVNQDNDVLRSHLEAVADEIESGAQRRTGRSGGGGQGTSLELVYGIRRVVRESKDAWEARRKQSQPIFLGEEDEESPTGLPDPRLADELEVELNAHRSEDGSRRSRAYSLIRRRHAGAAAAIASRAHASDVVRSSRRTAAGHAAPSDEEDSWSEPDVYAARRRMGGIDASVNNADEASETETDLEKRKTASAAAISFASGMGMKLRTHYLGVGLHISFS